ncbi:MAG: SEC-C domain-containing protein [Planctomycetes bacterium]|nr:SEC-C domain-containing protein [Planctomycetota bacterium]
MPFTLFRDRFRDLADRETRTIIRLHGSEPGPPAGHYAFLEMFCDEPGCDCRRVLLWVIDTANGRCEAVINFGWEDASFYAAWLREDDPDMVAELKGPALHLGPAQGRHADAFLDLAQQLVLRDTAYVARIQRHYAMFREDVEKGNRPGPRGRSVKIRRNDPCPCGSGRKYGKCCAGPARGAGAGR